MVDVFISYSKADRPHVERLDAALNAAGFTTWWDKGLVAGADFGPTIERHLADARAVVCLWTETSIGSQWVRAEAAKANAAGKLVPVKSAAVSYDQIPPPFNILDTGSIEHSQRIIDAVTALLARPAVRPSRWFMAKARTRQELLSWLGILGAVLTVAANLRGLADVARWARWLLANWLDVVAWFWRSVLFFLPRLTVDDASLLAILLFLSMNIAGCARSGKANNPIGASVGSIALGAVLAGSIYWSAFGRVMSEAPGLTGRIFDSLWLAMIAPALGIDTSISIYPDGSATKVLISSLVVLAVGLTGLLSASWAVLRLANAYIDTRLLFSRLLLIIVGVGVLAALSWGYEIAENALSRA